MEDLLEFNKQYGITNYFDIPSYDSMKKEKEEKDRNNTKKDILFLYAQKLHNMQYAQDSIDDLAPDLKKEGIVAVMGYSDDLCSMYGAISDEFDCYNGTTLYWNGANFFKESQKDDFLGYVDDQYPEFFEMCQKMFNDNCSYIKIEDGKDCQFEYTTNIPHIRFAVKEDDDLYCAGLLFFAEDLK